MDPSTQPTGSTKEGCEKLERRERTTIQLFLLNSMFLNVYGEDIALKLWNNLRSLYQSNSLVNKLFIEKKLYHLKMDDNDSVTKMSIILW